MNDKLEDLLNQDLLVPPADFTQRVMRRVGLRPAPLTAIHVPVPDSRARLSRARFGIWQRVRPVAAGIAWLGGGLLGLSQLTAFVFGLWLAASAV